MKKGGIAAIFGESINWLVNAGIVHKCVQTKVGVPLKMYEETENFKLYMNDVGLLIHMSNFPIYLIKNRDAVNETMLGMIIENYVASSLKYNRLNLDYWKNDNTSKVDFLLQSKKGLIIPLEVKTSNHVKSRSLSNYCNEYNPKYAIRVSTRNFGLKDGILSVPLYEIFSLNDEVLDEVMSL